MIKCENISAGYAEKNILKNINFTAHSGEFIAILGPNGSGKSTLLNVLSGVTNYNSGQIHIMGHDAKSLGTRIRAHHMAVVPQRLNFLPQISVQDMVLLGRYAHLSWLGLYSEHDYMVAEKALQEVGAAHLKLRKVHTLSGGELQGILLARALAQDTSILLLDELSAGLDLAKMIEIFDILERKKNNKACIVTVMHDVNLAGLYATRLIGLKQGQICFDGDIQQVFTEQNLQELYGIKIDVFKHPSQDVLQACPRRK